MTMSNDFTDLGNGVTVIRAIEYTGMQPYDVFVSTVQFERINDEAKRIYISRSGGKKPYAIMIRKYRNEIKLHKFILGVKKGDLRPVHHKDGDSLNNCDDNLIVLTPAKHSKIESRLPPGQRINRRFPNNSIYDYEKQSAKSTVYGVNIHKYHDNPDRQALLDVIGSYIAKYDHDDSEIMLRLHRLRQEPTYAEITDQSIIDDIAYLREILRIPSPIALSDDRS